ncbi:MAG: hypothetical protein ABSB63_04500 [Spirochaetia bacterium]
MTPALRALTRCPRSLLLVALLLGMSAPGWALDLSDGSLRLTLQERIGRFSLSYAPQARKGVPVPLLSAQDPRTTTLSVVVGNKIYRMGETSAFSQTVEKSARGARFVWKSSFLQVTETFTFIASPDSQVTNGVQIDIGLKNVSEKSYNAGIRYLFDTWLGEASSVHFRTDTLSQMSRELTLLPRDNALYWVSPLVGDPEDIGLQVMTSGAGVTVPDRVVFANWKRLSDASWSYETSADRNFSQLPYSVNDSAVSQYYDPRAIPPGTEVTITLVLGKFSREGFRAAGPASAQGFAASVEQSLAAAKTTKDDGEALRADLSTVNRILVEIDAALSAAGPVPEDKLGLMESALTDLGGRSSRYVSPDGK